MKHQSIDIANANTFTVDLFAVCEGWDGKHGKNPKPRAANEQECAAYAEFLRDRGALPAFADVNLNFDARGKGATFRRVCLGATFGKVTCNATRDERGVYQPAQYHMGAYSLMFPGANQRHTVTMETLGDEGEIISSVTLPVDPRKGGIAWDKAAVKAAHGPIAKRNRVSTKTAPRSSALECTPEPQEPTPTDADPIAAMLARLDALEADVEALAHRSTEPGRTSA